jgi:hypothetical protein
VMKSWWRTISEISISEPSKSLLALEQFYSSMNGELVGIIVHLAVQRSVNMLLKNNKCVNKL